MKNVFQLGAVVGKVEVPSHEVLRAPFTKGLRKKLMAMDGSPPKAPGKPKKKKNRHIPSKIRKLIKRPDYKEYMRSKRWRNRRIAYFSKFGRKCAVCKGKHNVGLHHLSYERLGNEHDGDLIALCWHCHYRFHEEHGVKRQSKDETYRFVQNEQEIEEFRNIIKTL